jgi:hypothetical protein
MLHHVDYGGLVTRQQTTASVLAKMVLSIIGMVFVIIGFGVRASGYESIFATQPDDPIVADLGSWILIGGSVWLLVSLLLWLATPGVWDAIAQFLVGLMLALSILATLILSAAFTLTGRPSLIDPSVGVPWRMALTVAVVGIGFAQFLVAQALVGREPPVPNSAIWRLRVSAASVLLLGLIAAWTSPPQLVAVLTLSALVYIAIELTPRGA